MKSKNLKIVSVWMILLLVGSLFPSVTFGETTSLYLNADVPEYGNSTYFSFDGNSTPGVKLDFFINGIYFTSRLSKSDGSFTSGRIILDSGSVNLIKIIATDVNTGSTLEQEYLVEIDDTLPVVTFNELPTLSTETVLDVEGTSDEEVRVEFTVNGILDNILYNISSEFGSNVSLPDGDNTIIVDVYDKAENKVSKTYRVVVDTTYPEILETNLQDLSPTYSKEFTVRGRVSEPATIKIFVDSEKNGLFQCMDGLDNDQDTFFDYPNDPGCDSPTDILEANPSIMNYDCSTPADDDGKGDGGVFGDDLGCDTWTDDDETNWNGTSQCNDGIDNDQDGTFDFNPKINGDYGCTSLEDDDESDDPDIGHIERTSTDSDGYFEQEVSLRGAISSEFGDMSSIGRIQASESRTSLSFDTASEKHDVKIVAFDSVGNAAAAITEQIEYKSCSSGDGDFLVYQSKVYPKMIIPDHVFKGIGQISFEIELEYLNLDQNLNFDSINLRLSNREFNDEDQKDMEFDMNIFDADRCQKVSDSTNLKWYVTCNLDRYPSAAYRNITAAYEEFKEQQKVRMPINIHIDYDRPGAKDNEIHKSQAICYDLEFYLDQRLEPDNIPTELLNESVKVLTDVIEAIDEVLPSVQMAKWISAGTCFVLYLKEFFSNFKETQACGGTAEVSYSQITGSGGDYPTTTEIKQIEWIIRGTDPNSNPDWEKYLSGIDPFSDKGKNVKECVDAKWKFYKSKLNRQLVCDRIFCPAVPSLNNYIEESKNYDKLSPCSAEAETLEGHLNYVTGDGSFEKSLCEQNYVNEYDDVCLFFDPLEKSKELMKPSWDAATGVSRGVNTGASGLGSVLEGLSLCKYGGQGANEKNTATVTDGTSLMTYRNDGGTKYKLGEPMSQTEIDVQNKDLDDTKITGHKSATYGGSIKFDTTEGELYGSGLDDVYVTQNDGCAQLQNNFGGKYDNKYDAPMNYDGKNIQVSPLDADDSKKVSTAWSLEDDKKYYTDSNGVTYYSEKDPKTEETILKRTPYRYVTKNNGKLSTKIYDPSVPEKEKENCYSNSKIQPNRVQKILIVPDEGLLNSMRCLCFPAIEGWLINLRNILTAIRSCFLSILVTGEYDSGICKAILSQYLCDFVYDFIGCLFNTASVGVSNEKQARGIKGFINDLGSAGDKIKESSKNRYGNSARFKALFDERQLIHTICLAAFGYDWDPDLGGALGTTGGGVNINSTGLIAPATRRFMSYNPNEEGTATYVYHVGYFLTAGDNLNWNIELLCSKDTSCSKTEFENGFCDCYYSSSSSVTTDTQRTNTNSNPDYGSIVRITGGDLTAGTSVGSGGNSANNPSGDPYRDGGCSGGDCYVVKSDRVRYDKVRLCWTSKSPKGYSGCVGPVPITEIGGGAPASCQFSISLNKFRCAFNNPAEGTLYFKDIRYMQGQDINDKVNARPFKQDEKLKFEVNFAYEAGSLSEKSPKYLGVTFLDENDRNVGFYHTVDRTTVENANGKLVWPVAVTAKDILEGKGVGLTSSRYESYAVGSGDSVTTGKYTGLKVKVNPMLKSTSRGGPVFVLFKCDYKNGNCDLGTLKYGILTGSEVSSSDYGKFIIEKYSDEGGIPFTPIFNDKFSFDGNEYLIESNSLSCIQYDGAKDCLGYFILRTGSTSRSLIERCSALTGEFNYLEWDAVFRFYQGDVVKGQDVFSQKPVADSTQRPSKMVIPVKIDCTEQTNAVIASGECADHNLDVNLFEKDISCLCDGSKISVTSPYCNANGYGKNTEGKYSYDYFRDLDTTLRECPDDSPYTGNYFMPVFKSPNLNGKCVASRDSGSPLNKIFCSVGQYFSKESYDNILFGLGTNNVPSDAGCKSLGQ